MHFHCEEHVNSSTETDVNQDRGSGKVKGKKEIFTFEHLFFVGDSSAGYQLA